MTKLEGEGAPRRTIRNLQGAILDLKKRYGPYEVKMSPEGKPWNGYDRHMGFLGDTEKFNGLLREWNLSTDENKLALRGPMGHHLADYLFSIFSVASDHAINLGATDPSDTLVIPESLTIPQRIRYQIERLPVILDTTIPALTAQARRIIEDRDVDPLFSELLGAAAKEVMGLAGKRERDKPKEGLERNLRGLFHVTLRLADSYGVDLEAAILQMTKEKSQQIAQKMSQ